MAIMVSGLGLYDGNIHGDNFWILSIKVHSYVM